MKICIPRKRKMAAHRLLLNHAGVCRFTFTPVRVIGQGFFGTIQQGEWRVDTADTAHMAHMADMADMADTVVNTGDAGVATGVGGGADAATRPVAIKTVKRRGPEGHHAASQIDKEIEVLRRLANHPFITKLVAVLQSPAAVHLVMQYCPGGDLFTFVASRMDDEANRAGFMTQMMFFACEIVVALEHMHSRFIMHGDIKCENVLIDAEGHIRLCDFGLSEVNVRRNSVGGPRGSELFMSPEQMTGNSYGLPVDVWALGYVFINMFTRVNAQRHQMGDAINVNVASVRNTKVAVAPAMKELIEQLLAVNPRDRPTMAQVKQHAAFAGVEWTAVLSKSIPVPWRPPVEMCATTFDDAFTTMPVFEIVHDDCTVVTLLN